MKKPLLLLLIAFLCLNIKAQNFKLSYISVENFLTQKMTLSQIETALKPSYLLVSKSANQWKFRDDSKSFEADLYVLFDEKTKIVREIAFVAPETRNIEYYDQLTVNLGFKLNGKDSMGFDVLQNSQKKLEAKLFASELSGKGMWYFRIYRI